MNARAAAIPLPLDVLLAHDATEEADLYVNRLFACAADGGLWVLSECTYLPGASRDRFRRDRSRDRTFFVLTRLGPALEVAAQRELPALERVLAPQPSSRQQLRTLSVLDGDRLVLTTAQASVVVFSATGQLLAQHPRFVALLAVAPDGAIFAATPADLDHFENDVLVRVDGALADGTPPPVTCIGYLGARLLDVEACVPACVRGALAPAPALGARDSPALDLLARQLTSVEALAPLDRDRCVAQVATPRQTLTGLLLVDARRGMSLEHGRAAQGEVAWHAGRQAVLLKRGAELAGLDAALVEAWAARAPRGCAELFGELSLVASSTLGALVLYDASRGIVGLTPFDPATGAAEAVGASVAAHRSAREGLGALLGQGRYLLT